MKLVKINSVTGKTVYEVEDAEIMFPNFSGKEGPMNAPGQRNFNLRLDDESARILEEAGFNVKELKPREGFEDQEPVKMLRIKINMNSTFPPDVKLRSNHGFAKLEGDGINVLDFAAIEKMDLSFNPYESTVGGQHYVTAYLSNLTATVRESIYENMFEPEDTPDSATNTMTFAAVTKRDEE